jgi:hypothetical protein
MLLETKGTLVIIPNNAETTSHVPSIPYVAPVRIAVSFSTSLTRDVTLRLPYYSNWMFTIYDFSQGACLTTSGNTGSSKAAVTVGGTLYNVQAVSFFFSPTRDAARPRRGRECHRIEFL